MKKLKLIKGEFDTERPLPYADQGARAGFPSPSQDYIDRSLDFNKDIIKHPSATFYVTVEGDSMTDAGIYDGDLAIVDRSLDPEDGDIVLAWFDDGYTIKYIDLSRKEKKGKVYLRAANKKYPVFEVNQYDVFSVFGVVIGTVRLFK